jgi:YhcH/YjgK/YiaL family protein
MILDTLAAATRYERVHPGFQAAFDFLQSASEGLADGRHEIDGERLFAIVAHSAGRGRDGAKLEVHRRYIDIQFCSAGCEVIGWLPLGDCKQPNGPFDESRDIQFFADRPLTWIDVPAGTFAIFYPDDAHAPLAGDGEMLKVVVKVAVDRLTLRSGG